MVTRRDALIFAAGGLAGVGIAIAVRHGGWLGPLARSNSRVMDIDIGYTQSMLVHHQQAITLASLATKGTSPVVSHLANRIVKVQSTEIAQLQGWLAALSEPALPPDGDLMGWMKRANGLLNINERIYLDRCAASPSGMAGLLSAEEISRLQTAADQDARDQLFLTYMITHHEGALAMSTLPARHGATTFIRQTAGHVLSSQANEVTLMKDLLCANTGRCG